MQTAVSDILEKLSDDKFEADIFTGTAQDIACKMATRYFELLSNHGYNEAEVNVIKQGLLLYINSVRAWIVTNENALIRLFQSIQIKVGCNYKKIQDIKVSIGEIRSEQIAFIAAQQLAHTRARIVPRLKNLYNNSSFIPETFCENLLPKLEITKINILETSANFCIEYLCDDMLGKKLFQLVGKDGELSGGIGKTYTLKFIARELIARAVEPHHLLIPLYTPLRDLSFTTDIQNDMIEQYWAASVRKIDVSNSSDTNFVFLLDGYNELPRERIKQFFSNVQNLMQNQNYKFILSSRRKLSESDTIEMGTLSAASFSLITIQPIDANMQQDYLGQDLYQKTNSDLRKLLDTPFYLSVYKNLNIENQENFVQIARLYIRNIEGDIPVPRTKTELLVHSIWYHIGSVFNTESNPEQRLYKYFALTKIFPSIANSMMAARVRKLSTEQILKLLQDVVPILKQHLTAFPEYQNDPNALVTFSAESEQEIIGVLIKYLPNNGIINAITNENQVAYEFAHDNYMEFFSSLYVATTFYLLQSVELSCNSETLNIQIEHWPGVMIQQVEELLNLQFDIVALDVPIPREYSPQMLVLGHVMCEIYEEHAKQVSSSQQLCELRLNWMLFFEQCFKKSNLQPTSYMNYFVFILCSCAHAYRAGIGTKKSITSCLQYSKKAVELHRTNQSTRGDGYNQLGKAYNEIFEQILNREVVLEAVDIFLPAEDEIDQAQALFNNTNFKENVINLACLRVLSPAHEKYQIALENNLEIARLWELGFVSKMFMVQAVICNSSSSMNLLAMMLENEQNYQENSLATDTANDTDKYGSDRNLHSFYLYDDASKIPSKVQSYAQTKVAEFIITGKIGSAKIGTTFFYTVGNPDQVTLTDFLIKRAKDAIKFSKRDNRGMAHYWEGRLNLLQNRDSKNNFIAEIGSFYGPKRLPSGILLSCIELIANNAEIVRERNVQKDIVFTLQKQLAAALDKTSKYKADNFKPTIQVVEKNIQKIKLHLPQLDSEGSNSYTILLEGITEIENKLSKAVEQ